MDQTKSIDGEDILVDESQIRLQDVDFSKFDDDDDSELEHDSDDSEYVFVLVILSSHL